MQNRILVLILVQIFLIGLVPSGDCWAGNSSEAGSISSMQIDTVFVEDWEYGIGEWYADNGVWTVDTPKTVGPALPFSGGMCAGTGIGVGYPPNAYTRLISPYVILPSIGPDERLLLKVWQWFSNEQTDAFGPDWGVVQVDTNIWTDVSGQISGHGQSWTQLCIDLSSFAGKPVRLGFLFASSIRAESDGWYVDFVHIIKISGDYSLPESFQNGAGQWSADNGIWQIGQPAKGPQTGYTDNFCAATLLTGNYPPGANSRLISPPLTLPTVASGQRLYLKMRHWFSLEETDAFGQDEGYVLVRTADGIWQTVAGPFSGVSHAWTQYCVDISSFGGQPVQLAFQLNSTIRAEGEGWFIDDLSLEVDSLGFVFPEGFEQGIGLWYADNGVWQVGEPTGDSPLPHACSTAAATYLDANYPSNANTRLISPELNLSPAGGTPAQMCFWHWFDLEETDAFGADVGYVQISVDHGEWITVGGPYTGKSVAWTRACVNLQAYAGGTARIAFLLYSTIRAERRGWFIDDLTFSGIETCCEGTTGNLSMTGVVDLTDLSMLIAYMTAPSCTIHLPCYYEANVNWSGGIDLSDLSRLIGYLTLPGQQLPACY